MRELPLETPLYDILGARAPLLKRFEKIGIKDLRDLLLYFPVRYEDFSKTSRVADLAPGEMATVQATVEDISQRRTRHGMTLTQAILADESGTIRATWFNQTYIAHTLPAGRVANFSGKISVADDGELYFNNPAYEIVRTGSDPHIHTGRLVPVYPETKGLTSRGIRFAVRAALKRNPMIEEWIPAEIRAQQQLPDLRQAIGDIHFPREIEDAIAARRRFSFENLFLLQLFNLRQKLKLREERAVEIPIDIERIKKILAALPFPLTPSQKKSLWEIMQDLAEPKPMNRLLQGDVGSGKTIVAAIAAITAAEHGFQTVFMAPTEILARQHFETFGKVLRSIAPNPQPAIGLATGSGTVLQYGDDLSVKTKPAEFWKRSADGGIAVIFGTHALIEKSARFKNLGLIVIDEQHRFGVSQRAALLKKTGTRGSRTPHFLSMSATPIPRTIVQTVFGNLDLSLITELPAGRKPIVTKIITPIERQATYEFIRGEIKKGRQAFVICPLIEPDSTNSVIPAEAGTQGEHPDSRFHGNDKKSAMDLKSVKVEYDRLSKKIFPDLRIAMLHGKMKSKEKETVMRDFKENNSDILVATSIIEVGVDVPNASIMIIEGADRFGLAQLYQFRGRIGRGEHPSQCFLMTESSGEKATARLRAILSAKNGFDLAEEDLRLRGPGEFMGVAQSGFSDTLTEALRDPLLVAASREAAIAILRHDPRLAGAALLKAHLAAFEKEFHRE